MRKFLLGLCVLAGTLGLFGERAHAVDMPRVVINELMWMGSSTSSSDEWIELRNTTSAPIDLAGWSLTKLSSGVEAPMLTIPAGTILANGFFVISNYDAAHSRLAIDPSIVTTDVALVNTNLQVKLYDGGHTLIDTADDGHGSPLAGEYVSGNVWKSMERNPSGADGTLATSWHASVRHDGFDDALKEFGTPGTTNSNRPPVIVVAADNSVVAGTTIQFDASESTDDEGELTFSWTFGDGAIGDGPTPTHVYANAGTYSVHLSVSDGEEASVNDMTVLVAARPTVATPVVQPTTQTPTTPSSPTTTTPSTNTTAPPAVAARPSFDFSRKVALNELLPDPDGPDEAGEYIEVVNRAKRTVNLRGWALSDGKKTYVIPEDLNVPAGDVVAFARSITKIVLGNATGDTVELRDPDGAVMSSVSYEKSVVGQAYAADERRAWQWTTPTPFGANIFSTGADYEDALHDALQSVAGTVTQTADDIVGLSTVPTANASPAPSVVTMPQQQASSTASIVLPSAFAAAVAGYVVYKKKRKQKETPFWEEKNEVKRERE